MPGKLIVIPVAGFTLFAIVALLLFSFAPAKRDHDDRIRVNRRWLTFEEFRRSRQDPE